MVNRSVADIHRGDELPFVSEPSTSAPATTDPPKNTKGPDWGPSWPMYGRTLDRTRDASELRNVRPPYKVRWKSHPGFLEYPPSYDAGVLYLTTMAGMISARDVKTGDVLWRRDIGASLAGQPAVGPKAMFFSTKAGTIYGLLKKNGKTLWKIEAKERAESVPAIEGGRVYFPSSTGSVRAIDAGSGRVVWRFKASDAVKGGPAIVGGRMYFGDYAGAVYCVRVRDGKLLWRTGTSGLAGGLSSGNFFATPAVRYGRVYISNTDGKVYSLVASSGEIAWSHTLPDWAYGSPAVAGNRVFATSIDGTFVAMNARTGSELWRHDIGRTLSSPTVIGDLVYVADMPRRGGSKGNLYAYNTGTGKLAWRFNDGNYATVIVANDHLVVAGVGTLYMLKPVKG